MGFAAETFRKYGLEGDSSIIKDWDSQAYGAGSQKKPPTKRISGMDIRKMAEQGAGITNLIEAYDSGKFDKYKHGGGTEQKIDKLRKFAYGLGSGSGSGDGGGKGGAGEGGGSKHLTDVPGGNQTGLDFYSGSKGLTPAEYERMREIELRGIDAENANKLQSIINSGKTEVAAIQRDASIYGSLVSGFW